MATTTKDRKPVEKKRQRNSQYHTEGGDEDDDHEADYDDDDWEHADNIEYEEEEEYDDDDEWGLDQIAYIDDEGNFYADEEAIDEVDALLAFDDDEYSATLVNYKEARDALAKARVHRGFYPVVVPANPGPQPRYGRGDGSERYGSDRNGSGRK